VEIVPEVMTGHVRLQDVSFTYPGSDRPALTGINLDVAAGTTLALVGETGSGKTTLASLVARLYDPGSGVVSIDGIDIRDMKLTDLAAVVGVVSQETYLLHTTVRENLRYARPDATDAEIEDAARAAQIHDLIAGLPDGYDTMVGSRGHRFSGGEKQRLAIARTLHRDRARRPARLRQPRRGPHHHHHRPPALDSPQRGPDRRPGPRPHRGVRHPHQPPGRSRPLRRTGRLSCRRSACGAHGNGR
jgi:ABC-type lipoprotein export system ATPase subunit